MLLGSMSVKAVRKTLMKLTPDGCRGEDMKHGNEAKVP